MPTSLLISPQALAASLADPATRPLLLDVRAAEAFASGHLPGAVHLDLWGFSLTDTDPAPLKAFLWMIEHVLALRGVTADVPIVVYGDTSDVKAARVFWFLEDFGHPSVRVLDGGAAAWTRAGLPLTTEVTTPAASAWAGAPVPSRLATYRDVLDRLDRPDATIVDTRTDGEYCGTTVRAARGGAIPHAVHLEWTESLQPDGTFKPPDALRAMYAARGITPDKDVVTYCQGAYRAAHTYLALRLIDYPRVRNYLGSWKEWGDRAELPIQADKKLEIRG